MLRRNPKFEVACSSENVEGSLKWSQRESQGCDGDGGFGVTPIRIINKTMETGQVVKQDRTEEREVP